MQLRWLVVLVAMLIVGNVPATVHADSNAPARQESPVPLARAHAHNDYWHKRPLFDALDHGFTSVEADVWLVDGKLLVGHDQTELSPDRTLKSLYLDPLKETVQSNRGSVYPGYKHDFLLWIDIKTEGESTYRALHQELREYQNMLTVFGPDGVKKGAVTCIVSGNRPRELMESQRIRYAGYDGRMSDLGSGASNRFMPIISDKWQNHFVWQGVGPMPENERKKLHEMVSTAHANGQKVRFWATPDQPLPNREAVWKELMKAKVDLINTDDLPALQQFLQENDPNPSEPYITW
ncbi:hypothetical protein GCM10011571_32840 [Marinithermofilum abyssi]|uniref:Altered inheritance of mitochondria protein 6 n=1 Tax=Marinithermofilum abyssi TaxID=1571185 RepID=A0A8J2VJX0_9BACL|nr:phosphatidylinositol-specific phospholipase C/glycerophosphodiester phosphodiesterase family protein [Marinithermofilum abyssi]GGE28169.1 hypothetical protein GCM10011571_32840 [Marinithermofilum abyssi]